MFKVTDDSKDDDIKEHNPDSIFKNVPKEDLQVEEAEEDSSNHTDIVNTRIQSKPKRGKSRCLKRKLKKQEETPIAIEEPNNNNKEEDAETEFIPYVSKDHYSGKFDSYDYLVIIFIYFIRVKQLVYFYCNKYSLY